MALNRNVNEEQFGVSLEEYEFPRRAPSPEHRAHIKRGGQTVGDLHWKEPGDHSPNPTVGWITVGQDFRRQGVATSAMDALTVQYGAKDVNEGLTLPEGTKFFRSWRSRR